MRPKRPAAEDRQDDLFRLRLEAIIDPRHPLVRLAAAIDWSVFDAAFEPLYDAGTGSPGLPTRLMVGLHMIKHMDGISDEMVCARFLDSPYVQHFCGEAFVRHDLPLDRSSMTNWRRRIGAEALEALLAESLATALRTGAMARQHMERITVDTTVQEKAVAHPTDARLLLKALETLVHMAKKNGILLRQSYARTAKWAARKAGALLRRGRRAAGLREIRWLRTRLGRVMRDVEHKTRRRHGVARALCRTPGAGPRLSATRVPARRTGSMRSMRRRSSASAKARHASASSSASRCRSRSPAVSSSSASWPCRAIPTTATPWPDNWSRPPTSPASR